MNGEERIQRILTCQPVDRTPAVLLVSMAMWSNRYWSMKPTCAARSSSNLPCGRGGAPDQVRREVRESLAAGTEGSFIFGTSHTMATGTKYDSFIPMMDEFDRVTCSNL